MIHCFKINMFGFKIQYVLLVPTTLLFFILTKDRRKKMTLSFRLERLHNNVGIILNKCLEVHSTIPRNHSDGNTKGT